MERLPHLVGYPQGLAVGEHPDIPHSIALALAGEDGWTDVAHGREFSVVQKGLAARRIYRFGDGVIVEPAFGPRKRFVLVELPAAAVVLGLLGWAVWS
ncbi:hypothetical protein [Micromonospora sp. L32]|uniref:hypothetical protein n=1 Tax=Micromonospora sp. L32 TaxID=3452214 RepID=UPI003F89F615